MPLTHYTDWLVRNAVILASHSSFATIFVGHLERVIREHFETVVTGRIFTLTKNMRSMFVS